MSTTRVPRAEFLRQMRLSAPNLVNQWIDAAMDAADFPEEFEVGAAFNLILQMQVRPMHAGPPASFACGGAGCQARLEISDDATPDAIEEILARRNWRSDSGEFRCPRCATRN